MKLSNELNPKSIQVGVTESLMHYAKKMSEFIKLEILSGNIRLGSPMDNIHRAFEREVAFNVPVVIHSNPNVILEIGLDQIIDIVCKYYDLDKKVIRNKTRIHKITDARKLYVYLARKYTNKTLEKIGERINKSHSSLIYMEEALEQRLSWDKNIKNDLEMLTNKIKNFLEEKTNHVI